MKKLLLITLVFIFTFSYSVIIFGEDSLYIKGVQSYENNKYQQSIDYFTDYITSSEEHYLSHYYLGLNYLKLKQSKLAYTSFKKANELYPDNYKILLNLGRSSYYMERYDEAEKYLKEALANNNKDGQVYNLIGLIKLNNNETMKAVNNFKKAIELNNKNYYAINNLGYSYLKRRNYKMAHQYLLRAVETDPQVPYIYNNLGIASENIGLLSDAKKYFQKALTVDPNYYKAQENYQRIKNKINTEE